MVFNPSILMNGKLAGMREVVRFSQLYDNDGKPKRYGMDRWERYMMERDSRITGNVNRQQAEAVAPKEFSVNSAWELEKPMYAGHPFAFWEKDWLKAAAEDLGVEYSSDEFTNAVEKGRKGSRKRKEAREVSKDDLASLRARLAQELKKKVGKGSRLYLTSGVDNLAQRMVDNQNHDVFYGEAAGWGIDQL